MSGGHSSTRHRGIIHSILQSNTIEGTVVYIARQFPASKCEGTAVPDTAASNTQLYSRKRERVYTEVQGIERAVSERTQQYQTPKHCTLNSTQLVKSNRGYSSIEKAVSARTQ